MLTNNKLYGIIYTISKYCYITVNNQINCYISIKMLDDIINSIKICIRIYHVSHTK